MQVIAKKVNHTSQDTQRILLYEKPGFWLTFSAITRYT
jgi:hypothetical protein